MDFWGKITLLTYFIVGSAIVTRIWLKHQNRAVRKIILASLTLFTTYVMDYTYEIILRRKRAEKRYNTMKNNPQIKD